MRWAVDDRVGAWVPHGRFVIEGAGIGPLQGLRFVAKDVFDVAGHSTGAGNPTWLATHGPAPQHACIVERVLAAGATLLGKVITDELAFSLHGDNVHYGTPLNSAAPDSVPGGSSSGSAAAVAARLVDFALATDTGGSTRVPASYCGLWGLRTTQGLVSTRGVVPLAPGFDTATWLAHDAGTFARVGEVLLPEARLVPRHLIVLDDACALADPAFAAPLSAIVKELSAVWRLVPRHERASGDSSLEAWRSVYATLAPWQSWRAHGDWIEREQPRFSPAIEARWQAARGISAMHADEASRAAARISARVRELLGADGIAVLPSAASVAPRRDAEAAAVDAVRLRTMAITCIAGLAGLPQVSIPFAAATPGAPFPVGVSLLGPPGSDRALIAIATAVRESVP